jgi:hypothetical protein
LTGYAADHKDNADPIHGFLPPIKHESTKEVRTSMKQLEEMLSGSGTFDETNFEELQLHARGMLRTEIQTAKVLRAEEGPPDRVTRTQMDLRLLLNAPTAGSGTSFTFTALECASCHKQLVDMCPIPKSHTCGECRLSISSTAFKRCEACDYDLCSSFCTVYIWHCSTRLSSDALCPPRTGTLHRSSNCIRTPIQISPNLHVRSQFDSRDRRLLLEPSR